jgi:peroxiredoxin
MKKIIITLMMALLATQSAFAAKVGTSAPAFQGIDGEGKAISLEQFKGKYVVLEWYNKNCPYVKAQYGSGSMQKTQAEWTGKGVVWLSIASSAPGKEGYMDAEEVKKDLENSHSARTALIVDADGKIGKAYDAKTTPHMFVIDPQGKLIYNGAIDNHQTTESSEVPKSTNYVSLALSEAMAGKKLTKQSSKPYGCGVKY